MVFFLKCVILSSLLCLQGCGPDLEEIQEKVLERDPSFKEVIDERSSMDAEVERARREYEERKLALERKISDIRQDLNRSRGEYLERVERIKRRLDPQITSLENEIRDMRRRLSLREAEIKAFEKSIKDIEDLVDRGRSLEMTQEEMRMWNERMRTLVREREEAVKDRDALIQQIETAGMKIRIMRGR